MPIYHMGNLIAGKGQSPESELDAIRNALAGKQPMLTGQPGQSVGFDANGNATAQEGCLPLSGGTISGPIVGNASIMPFLKGAANSKGFYFAVDAAGTPTLNSTTDPAYGIDEAYRCVIGGVASPLKDDNIANKLYVDSHIINTNLLDNGHFYDPINQRGKTTVTGNDYLIDRWKTFSGTISLTENGIVVGMDAVLTQPLEPEYLKSLNGMVLTGSILTADERLISGTGVYTYGQSLIFKNIGNPIHSQLYITGNSFQFYDNSEELTTVAAKLEPGPIQTLAHKEGEQWVLNDPPPNKALELLKCQMYYLGFSRWEMWPVLDIQPNYVDFVIPVPVKMRAKPSLHNLSANWLDSSWYIECAVNGSSTLRCRAHKDNHGLTIPLAPVEALDYAGASADL